MAQWKEAPMLGWGGRKQGETEGASSEESWKAPKSFEEGGRETGSRARSAELALGRSQWVAREEKKGAPRGKRWQQGHSQEEAAWKSGQKPPNHPKNLSVSRLLVQHPRLSHP